MHARVYRYFNTISSIIQYYLYFFIEIWYSSRSYELDTTNDIDFVFLCSLGPIKDNIAATWFLLIGGGHLGFFINGQREKMETFCIC